MSHSPASAGESGLERLASPGAIARWRGWIGFAVGVLLLVAAIWAVHAQGTSAREVWHRVSAGPAWLLALAVLLPVGNWLCMSACFWVLMRDAGGRALSPRSRLTAPQMTQLIGVAWLLNYVPMRPGLFGRVAYHRAVNGIALKDSLRAIVQNLLAGAIAIVISTGTLALCAGSRVLSTQSPAWLAVMIVPGLTLAAVARVVHAAWWRTLVLASAIRVADLCVWAARYLVVFALLDRSLTIPGAMATSAASQATSVVPFTGNGLGLREWAVGLTVSLMPYGLMSSTTEAEGAGESAMRAIGITADLVNRLGELAAAVVVGLGCWWWLRRRFRVTRP